MSNTRKLIADDGVTKRYQVADAKGKVVGYDDEPSTPTVDPIDALTSAVQALSDLVVAKTSATADDAVAINDALDQARGG